MSGMENLILQGIDTSIPAARRAWTYAGCNSSRLVFTLALLRFILLQYRQHNPCACPKSLNIRFLK